MNLVANLKKKISRARARATEGIFENFQNGHIFLKFLIFLNIKKKKWLDFGPRCRTLSLEPT
jgi:hypothetical protein